MQMVYLLQCYASQCSCCPGSHSTLGVFTSVEAAKTAANHYDDGLVWDEYDRASTRDDGYDVDYSIRLSIFQDEEDARDQERVDRIMSVTRGELMCSSKTYTGHLVSIVDKIRWSRPIPARTSDAPKGIVRAGGGRRRQAIEQ